MTSGRRGGTGTVGRLAAAAALAAGVLSCSGDDPDGDEQAPDDAGSPDVTDTSEDASMRVPDANPAAVRSDVELGERRPELRYTPPFGWMNDPNGLSFVDGRWHLFFQYNPDAIDFGNIGWGHAVSDDLLTWQTWPTAIEPTADQLIFSGSLVTDPASPACDDVDPAATCMVAVYTTNRLAPDGVIQTQDLATSADGGHTFTAFGGNPVIDLAAADFRDPKVFFHDETGRWIMVVVLPIERQVVLFGSNDLVSWDEVSRFGPIGSTEGIWECPDLFPAPIADAAGNDLGRRWVMKVDTNPGHPAGGSGAQWFVGDFDGTTFTPDPGQPTGRWIDAGRDFYCATTFHDGADEDGRPLWLGWMNNWTYAGELPTFPWRGSMTLPRRIQLRAGADGVVDLVQTPIRPEDAPIVEVVDASTTSLPAGAVELRASVADDEVAGSLIELRAGERSIARVEPTEIAGRFRLVRTAEGNDGPESFPGASAPFELPTDGGTTRFSMILDTNGIELWSAGPESGAHWSTTLLVPTAPIDTLVAGDGVNVEIVDLTP